MSQGLENINEVIIKRINNSKISKLMNEIFVIILIKKNYYNFLF